MNRASLTLIVLGLVWMILTVLLPALWALVTVVVIGTSVWAVWSKRVQEVNSFLDEANQLLERQPWRGLAIGLTLTVVYVFCLWLIYDLLAGWLVRESGVHPRQAALLATLIGLPGLSVLWLLYQPTGLLSAGHDSVKHGFRLAWILILVAFGWWYFMQPNLLFDSWTGEPRFWVAEESGEIFFFPLTDEVRYSPTTGEELRPGTREDAQLFMQEPWLDQIWPPETPDGWLGLAAVGAIGLTVLYAVMVSADLSVLKTKVRMSKTWPLAVLGVLATIALAFYNPAWALGFLALAALAGIISKPAGWVKGLSWTYLLVFLIMILPGLIFMSAFERVILEDGLGVDLSEVDPADRQALLQEFSRQAEDVLERGFEKQKASEEASREAERRALNIANTTGSPDKVVEIVAEPGQWSRTYRIPRGRYVRITYETEVMWQLTGRKDGRRVVRKQVVGPHIEDEHTYHLANVDRVYSIRWKAIGDQPSTVTIEERIAR